MSRKYKFDNKEGIYFVSFAVVFWADVFIRDTYCYRIVESLDYCQKNLGLEVFAWVIMPSHLHLIIRAKKKDPQKVLGRFKEFTSKAIKKEIEENTLESRKQWLLWFFKKAAEKNANVCSSQFWQHHNQPIELWSPKVMDQKLDYLHQNPVEAGFVHNPEDWKYSSAQDYAGKKGLLDISFL